MTDATDMCRLHALHAGACTARVTVTRGCAGCFGVYESGQELSFGDLVPEGLCVFLFQSAFPYLLALVSGGRFPWAEEAGTVDTQCPCPGGVRATVRRADAVGSAVLEVVNDSGVCPFAYKAGTRVPLALHGDGTCSHLFHSLLPAVLARGSGDGAAAGPVVAETTCVSPLTCMAVVGPEARPSVDQPPVARVLRPVHFNNTCWYFRDLHRDHKLNADTLGGLDPAALFRVYPYFLSMLYGGTGGQDAFDAVRVSGRGGGSLLRLRGRRYWFLPLIHMFDRLASALGRPYDLPDKRVEITRVGEAGDGAGGGTGSRGKVVFDHYRQFLHHDRFCPAVAYTLYPVLAGVPHGCGPMRCPSHVTQGTLEPVGAPAPDLVVDQRQPGANGC